MVHRHFNQLVAGCLDQRGNETVHAFERKQRAYAFVPHCFECAPGVAHPIFRVTAADGVRNPAGRTFDECVLALDAITADKIGAMRDFSEELWNVGRVVL
jgi:hypothetical protein